MADAHADLPVLNFGYQKPGILQEVNTGHAIQERVLAGKFVIIDDDRFELKQFHFHSPSEHTVDNRFYPMEVHFVHQNERGD